MVIINSVALMGRLTADPELRHTSEGIAVTDWCLAVDRPGTDRADFVRCVAWRGTAEFVTKWFAKGRMMAVTGSLQTRNYTDRDGHSRTATEVLVDRVDFTGDKRAGRADDGDLPFD